LSSFQPHISKRENLEVANSAAVWEAGVLKSGVILSQGGEKSGKRGSMRFSRDLRNKKDESQNRTGTKKKQ